VLELLRRKPQISLENALLYNDLQERSSQDSAAWSTRNRRDRVLDVEAGSSDANRSFLDISEYTRKISSRVGAMDGRTHRKALPDEQIILELKAARTLQTACRKNTSQRRSPRAGSGRRRAFEWKQTKGFLCYRMN